MQNLTDYQKRVKRMTDCVNLREPDRVPFIPVMEAYPVYYGNKTIKQCMYDYKETESCFDAFFNDYKPDLGWDPIMIFPAQALQKIGINWFKWPGNGIEDDNVMYQFIEDEYMRADEYDEAIRDMSHFMTTKWIPRSFSAMSGFKKLYTRNAMWFGFLGTFAAFDDEVIGSMRAAADAAEILNGWFSYLGDYRKKMKEKFQVPLAYGGFAYAPFDMLGDSLRGTEGILTDLYDQPDKLLALIDNITEYAIEDMIKSCENAESPYVWFWLHKGVDSFMSDEMYKKFYWPSLQKYIVALTEKNLVPVIYAEGANETRLKYFKDVPKGKVIYDFETIDMQRAKSELKDIACIAGNMPNYLLSYGTPAQIDEYIDKLIYTCAPGGGFCFDTGALIDDAKKENFEAMYNAVQKYGKR
jgi:Uroporphyrinogen-III decarboxylase